MSQFVYNRAKNNITSQSIGYQFSLKNNWNIV